jgi:DUF4097 and DUF4098 domain-containing protein YvlB
MAREENLLILKMLQDGTISAEQAAELLQALDTREERASAPPVPPIPPVPPAPPVSPLDPLTHGALPDGDGDAFSRARARIAAARERVAGVQEKLSAAEERLEMVKDSPHRWEQVAEALRDVPGARSVAQALRGIDPGRIAANARRQARRMARSVRSSLGDLNFDINLNLGEATHGEPTLSLPRESTAAIPAGGTLRVKNTLGAIEAQGADVPEARIAGVLKIWAADAAAAQEIADQVELVVEQGADGPSVSVRHPEGVKRVVLDLKLFIPEQGVRLSLLSLSGDVTARGLKGGAAVVLATHSGDARASELQGDVAVETASGDIALEGIAGNVTASSASGDVAAIRIVGQNFRGSTQSGDIDLTDSGVAVVTVETVSGDATVKRVVGRTLRVRAVSGDAVAEESLFAEESHLDTVSGYLSLAPREPLESGTISLVTVSGDADLRLPCGARGSVEVSTKSGDVDARFLGPDGIEKSVKGTGMVRLTEGLGIGVGAKISLSTMSGDLKITQDSGVVEIS